MADPQLGFAQLRAREVGPFQAFQQGQQQAQKFAQGQQLGQQKLRAGEQEFRLGQQEERLGQLEVSESEDLRNAQIFNTSGRQLLTLGGSPENQVVAARAMKQKFESAGLSTQPLDEFETKILAGDIDGANADLLGVIRASESILSGGAKAAQVQSGEILPDGTTVQLFKDGSTKVTSPEGKELAGKDRSDAIKEAREFGVEISGRGAEARAGAETVKQSIKKAGEAFDKIAPITKNMANLDKAIAAIDEGASTGVVQRLLPNIKAASIKLGQVRKDLGLDVVGAASFGALSEGELALALDVAIPDNLSPQDLRQWLVDKKSAQEKVRNSLEDAALFFSQGGTVGDFVKQGRERRKEAEAGQGATDTSAVVQPKFLGFE